jgi:hypothetical protein
MSETDDARESDRIDELAATIAGLVTAIATLTATFEANSALTAENTEYLQKKIAALDKADRRRRFSIRLMFGTIAADLMVTGVGLFILHTQAVTNGRIQESLRQNYTTSQQQAITRTRVLCPLYQVLLASAQDPVRVAALTTQEKKTFEANVRVIRDGYVTLGCQPPLPETPPTTG